MKETPKNHRKPWTKDDLEYLKDLKNGNTPTPLIAYKLGRTEDSVRNKANQENISLAPINKSPYDRKVSNSKKK